MQMLITEPLTLPIHITEKLHKIENDTAKGAR